MEAPGPPLKRKTFGTARRRIGTMSAFDRSFMIVIFVVLVGVLVDLVVSYPVMRPPLTWAKVLWPAGVAEPPLDRWILSAIPLAVLIGGLIAGSRVSWQSSLGLGGIAVALEQFVVITCRPAWIATDYFTKQLRDDAYRKLEDDEPDRTN